METIYLDKYEPAITQKEEAYEIFEKIMALNPQENSVVIDLRKIIVITTQCSRLIFGELYKKLGADTYYHNIKLKNQSEAMEAFIDGGLDSSISGRT